MACTSPIDIKKTGECSLKCRYWFKYGLSSVRLQNRSKFLMIFYDGVSDVMFNNVKYTPELIRIYTPSLHTYQGVSAAAEMIVEHRSNQGTLLVCIPIISTTASVVSTGSTLLTRILENIPTTEDITTLQLSDFNLGHFIPKSSYFSYHGTMPYACRMECDFIVFDPSHGNVSISTETLQLLQSAISGSGIPIVEGESYFNEVGTSKNGFSGENQIYIDCQPVSASDEIVYDVPSSSISPDTINKIIALIVGALFIVAAYFIFKMVIKSAFPNKSGEKEL